MEKLNLISINAAEPRDKKKRWMANNKISIHGKMSKLLAIRMCNVILQEANIDFEISSLYFANK